MKADLELPEPPPAKGLPRGWNECRNGLCMLSVGALNGQWRAEVYAVHRGKLVWRAANGRTEAHARRLGYKLIEELSTAVKRKGLRGGAR